MALAVQQQVVWFDVSVNITVATKSAWSGGKRFKGHREWFKWDTGSQLRPSQQQQQQQQVVWCDVSVKVAVERSV